MNIKKVPVRVEERSGSEIKIRMPIVGLAELPVKCNLAKATTITALSGTNQSESMDLASLYDRIKVGCVLFITGQLRLTAVMGPAVPGDSVYVHGSQFWLTAEEVIYPTR